MKRIIAFFVVAFFLGLNSQNIVMGADTTYEPVTTTKSSKKSSNSRSKSSQSTQKSSSTSNAKWVGKWVHPRLDTIFNEYVYEIYEIGKDGYMSFGESSSPNGRASNRRFRYTVKGNILYDDKNDPLLKYNPSNNSISSYSDSNRIFIKK